MPTEIRRKSPTVVEALTRQPARYDFFQAVRLLERASCFEPVNSAHHRATNPVGRFTPPESELVRFATQLTLGFADHELNKLSADTTDSGRLRWLLAVNFMSLTGSTGVLPFHYTELIFQRLKLKDEALKKFLDLFHHRTISLFYQAGIKYRVPVAYERHRLLGGQPHRLDGATHALLSIIGLGTEHLNEGLKVPEENMLYFAGFLSQRIRPASALKQMLAHFFGVPVQIKEFVGEWHDLIDDVRSRMPCPRNPKGQNVCLGRSAILGGKGWFAQGKMQITLGPLNQEQFQRFGPGQGALARLNDMVKLFAGQETESDYVLQVARGHLPRRIQLRQSKAPILGWDTWLASRQQDSNQEDDTLDIRVTSSLLN